MEITLYHTSGCHLCDKARDLLWPLLSQGYQLLEVDIADADALIEGYGLRIPVVAAGGQELDWPFDEQALAQFLAESSKV